MWQLPHSPIYVLLMSGSPKCYSILLYNPPFSRYKVVNRKCTEWHQNDLEHLTVKRIPCTVCTTEAQIFVCFALRRAAFKIQGCWKLQKSEMHANDLQTDLEHVTVKSSPYTLGMYHRGLNLGPFQSTIKHFQDTFTRLLKIWNFGNVPNDLRLALKSKQSKVPHIH